MKKIAGKIGTCIIAGLIGCAAVAYGLIKKAFEPYGGSLGVTLLIGFVVGLFGGFVLTLYDAVQALKKSADRTRWPVRHAGLVEFAWWLFFLVATISAIGVATFLFT